MDTGAHIRSEFKIKGTSWLCYIWAHEGEKEKGAGKVNCTGDNMPNVCQEEIPVHNDGSGRSPGLAGASS